LGLTSYAVFVRRGSLELKFVGHILGLDAQGKAKPRALRVSAGEAPQPPVALPFSDIDLRRSPAISDGEVAAFAWRRSPGLESIEWNGHAMSGVEIELA
jgi:hypothetical protein